MPEQRRQQNRRLGTGIGLGVERRHARGRMEQVNAIDCVKISDMLICSRYTTFGSFDSIFTLLESFSLSKNWIFICVDIMISDDTVQGDQAACSSNCVDFKTKVAF